MRYLFFIFVVLLFMTGCKNQETIDTVENDSEIYDQQGPIEIPEDISELNI